MTAIGCSYTAPAPEEPGSIGLHLGCSNGAAIDDSEMCSPDFRLARRSSSPRRQNRADFGQIFGFDE